MSPSLSPQTHTNPNFNLIPFPTEFPTHAYTSIRNRVKTGNWNEEIESIGTFTAFCVHELKPSGLPSYALLERFQAVCYSPPPSNKPNMKHDPIPSLLQQDLFHSRNFNLFARSRSSNSSHYSIKNNPSCLEGELSLQKKAS